VATVRLAALVLLAACGTDDVKMRIVIDQPDSNEDPEDRAFPDLDTVELQVALQGDPLPLATRTFQPGEDIELPDVPYGENLVIHMIGRVGPNEVAVGRTCPFSLRVGEDPPTPHLYFARTVKWAKWLDNRTLRPDTRDDATALTDTAGNAVYIGGVDQTSAALEGIDRFDAMNGMFDEVAKVNPRRNAAAATLGDGLIAVVGGTTPQGIASDILEVVNLKTDDDTRRVLRTAAASSLITTSAPATASTSDGHVVAFGGACGTCSGASANKPLATIVDIRADGAGTEQRELTATLAVARKLHTATRLSDDIGAPILIIGGVDAAGLPIARAELYRPILEQMSPGFTAEMVHPRSEHKTMRLPDGSILVIGGRGADGSAVRDLEIFTFDAGFQVRGQLPEGAGVTEFSVTPLPDGGILLAGGKDKDNAAVFTTYIIRLRPGTDLIDVVTTDRLSIDRSRHQATLLCDGTVMLVGGTRVRNDPERYNPPSTGRR
jgi:hypothetical protein